MLIDAISFGESAATFTWSKNTRKVQVQGALTMLYRAKEQLIKLLQTYRTYCESRKVLPPPKGGERAASMLRCPARSDYLVSLESGSESNRRRALLHLRILHSEQSSNRSPQVERVSLIGGQSGRVKFAEFVVHEFGANEKTLEDIDVKAAPNSNGKFSKSDVSAENAILPDETTVLQHSLNVHP